MAEKKETNQEELFRQIRAHDPLSNLDLPEPDESVLWNATAKPNKSMTGFRLNWSLRRPSARWAAPFAATAALALAIGATVGTLSKPTTPLFSLASGGAANSSQKLASGVSESGAMVAGDAKIGLWYGQTFDYSAADGLDSGWNDRGTAYRLVTPSSPERILKQLGELFGVSGKLLRQESEYENGYTTYSLGNTDGTDKAIWLYWGTTPSWNFYDPATNPTPKCLRESSEGCIEFDNTPPDASLLPASAKMKAFANSTMSALGLTSSEYRLFEDRDGYGAYVRAELLAGGTPVAVETYFAWNTLGLSSAGGTLGSLEQVSDVPLIAPSKAVSRISDWRWSGGLPGSFWQSNSAAASPSMSKDIAVSDAPSTSEPATEEGSVATPEPQATPEPIRVTIDKFESRLMVVWSSQGGIWVVPGYVLTSKDAVVAGQVFTVLAVADGVVQMPELEQGAVTY